MPGSKADLSAKLEESVNALLRKLSTVTTERDDLQVKLKRQEELTERARQDAAKARRDLESCRIAAAIRGAADSRGGEQAREDAKRRVGQLVREIDRCIALLKQ